PGVPRRAGTVGSRGTAGKTPARRAAGVEPGDSRRLRGREDVVYILGIHNSGWTTSAALLKDGRLVAGGAEERWNREKYSRAFPHQAVRYCLREEGIRFEDIEHIAVGWNPAINLAARYRGGFSDRLRYAGEWLYSVPNHVLSRLNHGEQLGTEQVFDLGNRKL